MLKKTICRGALGFPLGICIGHVIAIGISIAQATGEYYPCAPDLAALFESELAAIIFQAVLSGLLGTAFAAASVIWEMEKWSLAKQTGIYFMIVSLAMLPTAYFSHWMEHSLAGFALYFGGFIALFIAIWAITYFVWKSKIQRMNTNIKEQKL
jgi:hypothetical protein